MNIGDRERLIGRIRQLRRARGASGGASAGVRAGSQGSASESAEPADSDRLDRLEARIAHLESLLEGLQDSVHRETARQGKLIADLQTQVQPAAMGAALSEDARTRGL